MVVDKDQHRLVWEPINYNDLYYPIPERVSTQHGLNVREWRLVPGTDPPYVLVPAAGPDRSPPTKHEDPLSAGPITKAAPSLLEATTDGLKDYPTPSPTAQPEKDAYPTPSRPIPDNNLDDVLYKPPKDSSSKPPGASPVKNESPSSPEAPAPVPQQPSPDPRDLQGPNNVDNPAQANKPNPKKVQVDFGLPVDTPSNFDAMASALFPKTSRVQVARPYVSEPITELFAGGSTIYLRQGQTTQGTPISVAVIATISGHAISVSLDAIFAEGTPCQLPTASATTPLLLVGGVVQKGSNIIIGSSTITPSNEVIIAGQPISVAASGD
ncbi:MAG: hypothetical protein Q9205_007389 [Flavoplaca limonia]